MKSRGEQSREDRAKEAAEGSVVEKKGKKVPVKKSHSGKTKKS